MASSLPGRLLRAGLISGSFLSIVLRPYGRRCIRDYRLLINHISKKDNVF